MYSKEVTALILSDWAKGASAEETRKHLTDIYGKAPCLNSIYTHRHGLTTQHLVDELLRQQERDITKASAEELRLKYRNELLKIFIPQMTVTLNKNINETTINENINLERLSEEDKIAVIDAYRRLHRQDGSAGQSSSIH